MEDEPLVDKANVNPMTNKEYLMAGNFISGNMIDS